MKTNLSWGPTFPMHILAGCSSVLPPKNKKNNATQLMMSQVHAGQVIASCKQRLQLNAKWLQDSIQINLPRHWSIQMSRHSSAGCCKQ